MSTLAYAALTTTSERAKAGGGASAPPSGVRAYVDAMAALVPAEVLTLHALVLAVTTETTSNATRITDAVTLRWAFFGLLVLSAGFYVVPRLLARRWDRFDWCRAAIPPLAFVAWTMLQRATAFDALFPGVANAPRTVSALFVAVLLGAAATALGRLPHSRAIFAGSARSTPT